MSHTENEHFGKGTKILSDKCLTEGDVKYNNLTTEQAMTLINALKESISKIEKSFKYIGQYYYTDPMGSTFSNENEWRIICYGNTKEECEKYCESLGYVKTKDTFDGGYSVSENPNYYKE